MPRMLKINPNGQQRRLQTNPAIAMPLVRRGEFGILISLLILGFAFESVELGPYLAKYIEQIF
jgi:hypothetical protein